MSYSSRTYWRMWLPVGAAFAGVVYVFYVHHWNLRASTVFASLAWLSLIAALCAGWYMGISDHVPGRRTMTNRTALEAEKRTILRALKELEFDHGLGKTSTDDYAQLAAPYRARMMEIYRGLDALSDPSMSSNARTSMETEIERIKTQFAGQGKRKGA